MDDYPRRSHTNAYEVNRTSSRSPIQGERYVASSNVHYPGATQITSQVAGGNTYSHVGGTHSHVVGGQTSYVTGGQTSYVTGGHTTSHVVGGNTTSYVTGGSYGVREGSYIREGEGRGSSYSPRRSESRRRTGAERVVSTVEHPEQSRVVAINEGEGRVIEEHIVGTRVVNEYENRGQEIVHSTMAHELKRTGHVHIHHDEPRVVEKIVNKEIEVIKENPIPVEKYVDVPYDVIVERPIEKIIEKEIVTEKTVEVPVYKQVEIPIEKVVEVPYERVIEEPREIIKHVDRPYETVKTQYVDKVYENIVYDDRIEQIDYSHIGHIDPSKLLPEIVHQIHENRQIDRPVYRDNIITNRVEVPVEKLIEVPIERIVEVPVENVVERKYQVENVIEKTVEVPVEHVKQTYVEQLVEVPEYIDNPIANPVPVPVYTEEIIKVPVPNYIEKPVYIPNVIEHIEENIITNMVPVPQVMEIPIENLTEHRVDVTEFGENVTEKVVERPVPVEKVVHAPIEYLIEKTIEVPVENCQDHNLDKYHPVWEEETIEKMVNHEKVTEVEKLVEKPVNIQVERIVEDPEVEEVVEEKIVYVEQIMEKKITKIVEKEVIVPVERIVNVPIHVVTERFVPVPKYIEQEVVYERHIEVPVAGTCHDDVIEVKDESLEHDIMVNQKLIADLRAENATLAGQWEELAVHLTSFSDNSKIDRVMQERINLNSHISYLQGKLNCIEQDINRLSSKATKEALGQAFGLKRVIVENPKTEQMRSALRNIIRENQNLVQNIKQKAIGPTMVGNGMRRPNQNPVPQPSTDPRDIAEKERAFKVNQQQALNSKGGGSVVSNVNTTNVGHLYTPGGL